jgi:DNA processing protein
MSNGLKKRVKRNEVVLLNFRERLIHIHHCRGAGWQTIRKLLSKDPELRMLYDLTVQDFHTDLHLPLGRAERLFHDLHHLDMTALLTQYRNSDIHIITVFDDEYPELLKAIYDPPWVLYTLGRTDLLKAQPTLAVVGTRRPSAMAYQNMRELLSPLIQRGWVIVSGMALGIDGFAHELSLNGKTIAVLGSGLYHPYPASHRRLFEKLTAKQLVISEYPPHTPPHQWQFPVRNRIISGLSRGVLVVEAKEKSGSLITADQAMEQGRDIFAVPGPAFDPHYKGTHGLIQQGAKLVMSAEDILDEFGEL